MRLPVNHTWASPSSLFAKSKRRGRKEGEIFLLEEWRREKKTRGKRTDGAEEN
jgi:hypothetical protein